MNDKKFSILISKENSPPYYIQVPNWIRNFIIYILPLLSLAFFLMLMFNFNLLKYGRVLPSSDKDTIREKLNNEVTKLSVELKSALERNHTLRSKVLDIGGSPSQESEAFMLNFIKLPQTFTDMTSSKLLEISRWQLDLSPTSAKIAFQLNNKSKEKSRGFLFVVQFTKNSYHIFPTPNHPEVLFQRSYLEGNNFSVSFFKPVDITFESTNKPNTPIHYLVLVFSLDGDLLIQKNFGPYTAE